MELRKGYKQTEVGVIPSDWEVKRLGECLLKNPDYGINAAAVDYDDTLPTYLRITDISEDGKYLNSSKVSVDNTLANSYYLDNGDIVFARTGASVGKTYLYIPTDGKLVFAGFLIRVKSNPDILNPSYLIYLTQTKKYWTWVAGNSMRSGQPGLNSSEYKSFQIPIPPTIAEQTAIATALSDADALISSLGKLIEKKRNIKQGAMHQLLKPKKGWVVKKLGDYVKITSGESPSRFNFGSNGIPYYKVDQLNNCEKYLIETPYYVESNNTIPKGSIIFPKRGASILLNKVRILKENALMDTNLMTLTLTEEINIEFLYYLLIHTELWRIADTTSIPQINNKHINPLELSFPTSAVEQKEIALILSDMDNEITALEKKLSKSKMLKQGMMQELLMGKIRLI